jgi:hypothetical protein
MNVCVFPIFLELLKNDGNKCPYLDIFFFSLGYIPSNGIVKLYYNPLFNILWNCHTFFNSSIPFYIPTRSNLSKSLPIFVFIIAILVPLECVPFLVCQGCWIPFHVFVENVFIFFTEIAIEII